MELWVRSQDKENLIKVFDIKIKEIENRTYKYGDIGKSNEFAIVSNDIILGCYETKERALEVLDEIQELIKPKILITEYECECKNNPNDKLSFNLDMTPTKTEIQELSTIVYEMPKK